MLLLELGRPTCSATARGDERKKHVLGPSWGPPGPCWSVGTPKRRKGKKHRKTQWKINNFSLSGPSWEAFFGTAWAVLEASWPVLGPSWASWSARLASRGLLGPSWGHVGAFLACLGALLGPKKSRDKLRGAPGEQREGPGDFAIWALVPLMAPQD